MPTVVVSHSVPKDVPEGDEIFVHVVPVLFGSGTRLFAGLGSEHISLETAKVIETSEVIHLRFCVVK
jgi:hypothetical protein